MIFYLIKLREGGWYVFYGDILNLKIYLFLIQVQEELHVILSHINP